MHLLLVTLLGWYTKHFILRLMLSLGIFTISSSIMSSFLDAITNAVMSQANSLSGVFAQGLAVSGLLDGFSIIIGAYSTAITIKGIKSITPGGSA